MEHNIKISVCIKSYNMYEQCADNTFNSQVYSILYTTWDLRKHVSVKVDDLGDKVFTHDD